MKKLVFLLLITGAFACTRTSFDFDKELPFERKTSINDQWAFQKGDIEFQDEPLFDTENWRIVDLPHDWAIEGPFSSEYASGTGYLPGGIAWYEKKLLIEDYDPGRKYTLLFDGAYQNAEVWVNGNYMGKRPYGYSSFYYDITPYVDEAHNFISVRLDHSIVSDSRWYTGNGIYRNVWLITRNKIHIPTWGAFVSTPSVSPGKAEILVDIDIVNSSNQDTTIKLINILTDKEGREMIQKSAKLELAGNKTGMIQMTMELSNPDLWSPETPEMYTMQTYILNKEGIFLDKLETPFGIRNIRFSADSGFFCNGKSYKLKGVCMHHDYGALGSARPPEAIYPVLKKLKDAGCNAIRTSHNPEDPAYLSMLDTMGFFVMEEGFDEFLRGKKKWIKGRNVGQRLGIKAYPEYYDRSGYSDFYYLWAEQDIKDMVRRDRNHPSIIMWSVGNETDYPNDPYQDPNVKSTYDPSLPTADEIAVLVTDLVGWIKEIDTSRAITQALANVRITNEYGVPELLDVVGYNYQEYRYEEDHKNYPDRVIYGSENDDNPDAWKAVRDNDYISGQFLWTGMDYHGEAGIFTNHSFSGGIIDYCGFEKPDYYYRKSLWTEEPMAKLAVAGRRWWSQRMHWNWEEGRNRRVICYTNCDEAELFLNGESLGKKPLNQDHLSISWEVEFEPGILTVKAYRDGQEVSSDTLQTAGDADHLSFEEITVHSVAFNYDLIQVAVKMVDENGIMIPYASSSVSFELEGSGEIIGVCNSDYQSLESYQEPYRKLYEGRCLVIIKTKNKNDLSLHAFSEELDREFTFDL